MEIFTTIHHTWHRFWGQFHQNLIDSCLDETEQLKLIKKRDYHHQQLTKCTLD
ncbi:hypothetical protein [Ammoniphilus sp. 3BR4]|uniref:hypothetical protein n=1 Tax=Ammoniphilus sp. 3BR4 TaxID=3158265 RepID=UPI003467DC71